MSDRLLTAPEVAEMLSVPVTWVREQTRSGVMPCVELGRYRRYVLADVLAWVESCKKPGRSIAFRRHSPDSTAGPGRSVATVPTRPARIS